MSEAHSMAVVLVGTSHPGNVGAAARAMRTMGLDDLRLAAPNCVLDERALATAAHAGDLLAAARVFPDLPPALAVCGLVLGMSARPRRIGAAPLTPRVAAAEAVATSAGGSVALVFGRERNGLTNEELALCHNLVHIPANPGSASLNLAAAVQILAYEVRLAQGGAAIPGAGPDSIADLATGEHLEGFYRHLAAIIDLSGYASTAEDPYLMRRLRRLFNRARPEAREVNILRGLLVAIERRFGRTVDRGR